LSEAVDPQEVLILLSQRTHAAVEDLVEVESVGELQLKGFSRPLPPVDVVRLRSADAPAGDRPVRQADEAIAPARQ
jgi:class 3 adenylate cyclase